MKKCQPVMRSHYRMLQHISQSVWPWKVVEGTFSFANMVGVFTGNCGTSLDHGVTLVGYGSTDVDYWIVNNSWGPSWAEKGYIRFQRNIDNSFGKCGIAMQPSYLIKIESNPPNPGPSPPSLVTPPAKCDDCYACPVGSTCCCAYGINNFCL